MMNPILKFCLALALAAPVFSAPSPTSMAAGGVGMARDPRTVGDTAAGLDLTLEGDELQLGSAMVIEGKVEKPQVQFPLLREPPPLPEIQFGASFLENILRLDPENVPDPN